MPTEKIDNFYAKQGIKVRFNTLGYNDILIKSYVKDFEEMVSNSVSKKSHAIKVECYNTMYNFAPRKKLTGFENLKQKDNEFRNKALEVITESQFTPALNIDYNSLSNNDSVSYKDQLKQSLIDLEEILLYISGGLDSELVATTLLDMGKTFKPVVFIWTNNDGNIINSEDTNFAFEFCKNNNLEPLVETINIEKLWGSEEFFSLAKEIQIISPQLLTYAYIIKYIDNLLPNRYHLFGGEVRFFIHLNEGKQTNLVFLNKVIPVGYNGGYYTANAPGICTLTYFGNTGQWQIAKTGFATNSGPFTTTPSSTYEFSINSISTDSGVGPGQILPNPASVPTSYATISPAGTELCRVQGGSPSSSWIASFEIYVRAVGDPLNVYVSGVTLSVEGIL